MKNKIINQERIEGRVYQHNLTLKKVQNKDSANYGKEFISGTLDIATDEDALNVLSVHFTYVVEMTKSGKTNVTFGVLKSIIESGNTWLTNGKDAAPKVRVNTALALNDFYTQDGQLVSAKRSEGGFVNVISTLAPVDERNRFDCDMIITSTNRVEVEDGDDYLTIKGAVFNSFNHAMYPVEFVVRSEDGMNYFESLDASPSNPIFTEVKGAIISTTVKQEQEEESAFGKALVKTVSRTTREWCVDWARPVEYDFGSEDTMTAEDLKKAIQDREVYLADVKKRHDDYIASRDAAAATPSESVSDNAMNIPAGGFNF